MSIYCPLSEALGIDPGGVSILDCKESFDDHMVFIPGAHKGHTHTEETKERIRRKKLGKSNGPHSPETRRKIGLGNKGKIRTTEMNEKNRQWHLGRRFNLSEEVKKTMSEIALNRPRYECPVCGKKMTKQCFDRYGHGPNCKQERK